MTSSPVQTTDYEEREVNGLTDLTKVVKTQVNVEFIRKQMLGILIHIEIFQ